MAQITLSDYLQQTEDAISSSRVDDALTRCQFMLSNFPEALEIQRLLGEVYLIQGRMEEAQQIFDWILTNDPEHVLAYCNRAHLSELLSEYDIALDCYQQAYELSRGNGQIREEFNRLSEKIGQKGFMFSHAGLARLYTRGDLLSEAIQEWDTVLSVSPDRLDARVGLLETYWRAGQMEKVEKLAEQILQAVPGCLKALLLHACVISAKDSQHSQELLRRAETLDPNLTTAQVLFADALASQPDDPFLRQLKKAPALLPDPASQRKTQAPQQAQQEQRSFTPASDPVNALAGNMDAIALWGKDAYGSSDTTLVRPRSDTSSSSPEMGVTALWGENSIHDNSPLPDTSLPISASTTLQSSWNTPLQETNNAQSAQQIPTGGQEHPPEPWELLQDALNQFDTIGTGARMVVGNPAAPYEEEVPLWDNLPGSVESSQPASNVSSPISSPMPKQQESVSSPGVKLDPWGVPMEEPAPEKPLPLIAEASPKATEDAVPLPSWLKTADEEKLEEDEESFFGPSWLKSLGATSMAEEEEPATKGAASEPQTPQPEYTNQHGEPVHTLLVEHSEALMQVPLAEQQPAPAYNSVAAEQQPALAYNSVAEIEPYESWTQTSVNNSSSINDLTSWSAGIMQEPGSTSHETGSPHQDTYASSTHMPQFPVDLPVEQPIQPETLSDGVEQNLVTTLEELQQSLLSRGFIPLEPNSLATLTTQEPESPITSHNPETLQVPEGHDVQDIQPFVSMQEPQETPEEPSLPSALAQLGNFVTDSPFLAVPVSVSPLETVEQNEEPSWLRALKDSSPAPAVPTTPIWSDASLESSAPTAYTERVPEPLPAQVESFTKISHNLPPLPETQEIQQTTTAPTMRGNPLLDPDGELETTMRRPAVRLQSMQQYAASPQRANAAPIVSRPPSRERNEQASKVTRPANENLSYRDRLVKGYQHQLVGDYDEAMQEYRIIIRSGTDLLNEVVSNVRALLKLAPNYTAGYRVLGDAYMRQGEYLQAMEAYNKALTMTKKVKSRT